MLQPYHHHRSTSLLRLTHAGIAACIPLLWALAVSNANAQPLPARKATDLKELFESSWARQPEAQSLSSREEAQAARREAASSWTAEPPALELLNKTDRLNRNQGSREQDIGVALPLWLPGERSRSMGLADAEAAGFSAKIIAARFRTAGAVRDAYWTWQRAQVEYSLAEDRLNSARVLAADVARRLEAGDLSRADFNQAAGNLAAAEMALAEKQGALSSARLQLRTLAGVLPADNAAMAAEKLPPAASGQGVPDTAHPQIAEFLAQADIANRSVELARVQTRANPELMLGTTRERSDFVDPYQQSITVALRIPFGSTPRHRAKIASAMADAQENEGQARLARERLATELEAAWQRTEWMRTAKEAAERRVRLAGETREFFDRSFRLGETDLPSRLRVELEAIEALRQARLATIDYGIAISGLRQALGLLPE